MVPPPWHLVSPSGVVHVVRDEAQLKLLSERYGARHPPWAALAALVVAAQLTRGPPAECLQVDMRTRSSS